MSEATRTTWTCDRCGERQSCERGGQPSYWISLRRAQPPNHAEPRRMGDLCTTCRNAFDEWWRNGNDSTITVELDDLEFTLDRFDRCLEQLGWSAPEPAIRLREGVTDRRVIFTPEATPTGGGGR